MNTLINRATVVTLVLGVGLVASVADAEDDRDGQPSRQRIKLVERVAGKHWIGIHAVPIDDALKSQLNLEDRLIVRSVMSDSPAARGGLERHDILLKFGDRDLHRLEDLLKAVSANEDKAVKLEVLRGGKKLTLDIQPTERPSNIEVELPDERSYWKPLDLWLGGDAGRRLRIVGPGVFAEPPKLPGNLSINITKQDDQPAKITVNRDGETWEITEDEIDELPDDLREHVRRQLDGTPRAIRLKLGDNAGEIRIDPRGLWPNEADAPFRERMERALRQLDKLQQRLSEDDPFKALQEELKSLRQEVERLRDRRQPANPADADPDATDA